MTSIQFKIANKTVGNVLLHKTTNICDKQSLKTISNTIIQS